jgi:hypothetical protein
MARAARPDWGCGRGVSSDRCSFGEALLALTGAGQIPAPRMVGMNPTILTSPLGAPRAPLPLPDWSLAVSGSE